MYFFNCYGKLQTQFTKQTPKNQALPVPGCQFKK